MRLIKLLSLCVLMTLVSARPASAWFEWLDYLSGPGRFWGVRADVRMWCAGQETPRAQRQRELTTALRNAQTTNNIQEWKALAAKIQSLNDDLHAVKPVNIQMLLDSADSIKLDDFTPFRARIGPLPYAARRFEPPVAQPRLNDLERTATEAQNALDDMYPADVAISAGGIFISLCSPDIERTWAFELGSSILFASGNPAYAGGKAIGLITYTAGVTRQLPPYVDVGFLGGEYTFWSDGFDTFHGLIVEPFVDLHFPAKWATQRGQRGAWSHFSARVGLAFFPQGFDTSQFGASPGTARHISGGEPTRTVTVYYRMTQ